MSLLQFVNKAGGVLEKGDVVVIAPRQPDPARPGMPTIEVDLAQSVNDTSVCGIVHDLYAEHKPEHGHESDADGTEDKVGGRGARKRSKAGAGPNQSFMLHELQTIDRTKIAPDQIGHLVASGFCLMCKVDADISPIKPGDLLTTSATKGHAQKAAESTRAAGAVLGKALGSLKKGKGAIPVLVTLQ